jgi:hypothetical protein
VSDLFCIYNELCLHKCVLTDVVYYDKVPLEDAYEKLQNYIKSYNDPSCLTAVNVIKQCLQEYRYFHLTFKFCLCGIYLEYRFVILCIIGTVHYIFKWEKCNTL